MSFAKRQLEKFGWKEGQGIGKNLQGTTKVVFVSKKNNTAGIGSGSKADLFNPWWNDVYAQAASRIVSVGERVESEKEACQGGKEACESEKKKTKSEPQENKEIEKDSIVEPRKKKKDKKKKEKTKKLSKNFRK
jgi:hypothetical protein